MEFAIDGPTRERLREQLHLLKVDPVGETIEGPGLAAVRAILFQVESAAIVIVAKIGTRGDNYNK